MAALAEKKLYTMQLPLSKIFMSERALSRLLYFYKSVEKNSAAINIFSLPQLILTRFYIAKNVSRTVGIYGYNKIIYNIHFSTSLNYRCTILVLLKLVCSC